MKEWQLNEISSAAFDNLYDAHSFFFTLSLYWCADVGQLVSIFIVAVFVCAVVRRLQWRRHRAAFLLIFESVIPLILFNIRGDNLCLFLPVSRYITRSPLLMADHFFVRWCYCCCFFSISRGRHYQHKTIVVFIHPCDEHQLLFIFRSYASFAASNSSFFLSRLLLLLFGCVPFVKPSVLIFFIHSLLFSSFSRFSVTFFHPTLILSAIKWHLRKRVRLMWLKRIAWLTMITKKSSERESE